MSKRFYLQRVIAETTTTDADRRPKTSQGPSSS